MPIDASIISGLKPMQSTNPLDMYEAGQRVETNRLAGVMNGLKMDEYQRGVAEQNSLRDVYKTFGANSTENINKLYGAGLGKQAGEYAKSAGELAKDKASTNKSNIETQQKVVGMLGSTAYALSQSPTLNIQEVQGAIERLKTQLPAEYHSVLDVSKLPQDPEGMRRALTGIYTQSIETEKLMTDATSRRNTDQNNATSTANNTATNATSRSNNAATVGATIRGQNMTNDRARDTLEAGKQQIVQTDNGPVLINTRTGSGMVVNGPDGNPLPGVTKPLNDSQSKALLFGSRMRDADKAIATLSGEGKVNSIAGSRAPVIGGVINAMSSDNNQMLNQAKTDFMAAVLRRESGAAISTGEYDTANKQYFPQIGDEPGVIAQKAANRQLAMKGILMEVPEKHRNSLQATQPGAAPQPANSPKAGAVQDGFRFKGGNPSDPKSWEKM